MANERSFFPYWCRCCGWNFSLGMCLITMYFLILVWAAKMALSQAARATTSGSQATSAPRTQPASRDRWKWRQEEYCSEGHCSVTTFATRPCSLTVQKRMGSALCNLLQDVGIQASAPVARRHFPLKSSRITLVPTGRVAAGHKLPSLRCRPAPQKV